MAKRGRKRIDRTGQRWGHITVLGPTDIVLESRVSVWLCRCDCGREFYVRASNLHEHGSKSCGCERDKATRERWEEYRRRHTPGTPSTWTINAAKM